MRRRNADSPIQLERGALYAWLGSRANLWREFEGGIAKFVPASTAADGGSVVPVTLDCRRLHRRRFCGVLWKVWVLARARFGEGFRRATESALLPSTAPPRKFRWEPTLTGDDVFGHCSGQRAFLFFFSCKCLAHFFPLLAICARSERKVVARCRHYRGGRGTMPPQNACNVFFLFCFFK